MRFVPYTLPLREAVVVGGQRLTTREGCLLVDESLGDAGPCVADVAPLPGLHAETWREAVGALAPLRDLPAHWDENAAWRWDEALFGLGERLGFAAEDAARLPPSALFAAEAWLLQRALVREGAWARDLSLRSAGLASLHEGRDAVDRKLARLRAQGVTDVKLKLGRQDWAADLAALERVRVTWGREFRWRLDANGAWPVAEASALAEACRALDVDFVEDPFPAGARAPRLPVPLAHDLAASWDEARTCGEDVGVLVVKPCRVGAISGALRHGAAWRARGGRVILSHCYESDLSLPGYAALAGRLGWAGEAMGFGTIAYLGAGLGAEAPVLREGAWRFAARPRLGETRAWESEG